LSRRLSTRRRLRSCVVWHKTRSRRRSGGRRPSYPLFIVGRVKAAFAERWVRGARSVLVEMGTSASAPTLQLRGRRRQRASARVKQWQLEARPFACPRGEGASTFFPANPARLR
jgi:hypothetical protein